MIILNSDKHNFELFPGFLHKTILANDSWPEKVLLTLKRGQMVSENNYFANITSLVSKSNKMG